MDSGKLNPFTPGAGDPPPLLAGRHDEWGELAEKLARIRADKPGGLAVMCGPRGNGKTSLLGALEKSAKQSGVRVEELEARPSTGEDPSAPWQFASEKKGPVETTTKAGVGISNVISGSRETKTVDLDASVDELRALAESGPLLLLVDEAHVLPPAFGRDLLHKAQGCVKAGLPLLAAFAGTPGLRARFRSMHTSFWERATKIKIGRLGTDEEVRKALAIPAKESGFPMDGDALDLLVQHSQRYPFFIQVLGAAAWKASRKRNGESGIITLADAQAGVEKADAMRDDFYEERREELFLQGVLDEAEAISEEMVTLEANGTLSSRRLGELFDNMIAKGLADDPQSVHEKLVNLGLIWQVGVAEWEPGIPSLCAHLVKHRGVRHTGHKSRDREAG